MVDLRKVQFVPTFLDHDQNIAAHLVFTASGSDVSSVWVDGKLLVEGGQLLSVDESSVMADGQAAAEELFERRARVLEDRR